MRDSWSLLGCPSGLTAYGEGVALRVGQLIQPLLIGPLRKYAPVDASAVAGTLVKAAASAPSGVTIIESDAIR